jgi:hypothetical protein
MRYIANRVSGRTLLRLNVDNLKSEIGIDPWGLRVDIIDAVDKLLSKGTCERLVDSNIAEKHGNSLCGVMAHHESFMESDHVPTLAFRCDPVDSASVTNPSIASTSSSIFSSKIPPGIGSLTGRFIEGFGKTVLHGIESVTVIRRRLADIRSICPLSDDPQPEDVHRIYDDLLELSRFDALLY